MKIRKILVRILILIFLSPFVFIFLIYLNYHLISFSVKDRIFYDIRKISFRTYTLIPGSGTFKPERWTNHTLIHRLEAARELYLKNKTIYIIASGSIMGSENDEPAAMKNYLVDKGVSEINVLKDTSGIRTWETVLNFHENFPGEKIIIVSQKEHLERALFIADRIDVDAVGYIADPGYQHRYLVIREYLARAKCSYESFQYSFKSLF